MAQFGRNGGSLSPEYTERLKYLEEGNHLTYLFLSLLARSIDSERINEAHPSFIYIIDQLSPDEATILSELKHNEFKFSETLDLDVKKNWWDNRQIVDNHFPVDKLAFPQNFSMYYDHLYSLSLIDLQVINEEILIQNEILVRKKGNRNLITSDFGKLFIKACVP